MADFRGREAARSRVCTWRRNRILCKYPNQIHILKFNCFIQKFYLPKEPGARSQELRAESQSRQRCPRCRRVWQTQARLGARTMPPIFNLFPLFNLKKKKGSIHTSDARARPHLHPQPVSGACIRRSLSGFGVGVIGRQFALYFTLKNKTNALNIYYIKNKKILM